MSLNFLKQKKDGKSRDFINNIQWLVNDGIISICYNINHFEYPLDVYRIDNQFKLYINDASLFLSTIDEAITTYISENQIGIYKGYIYESTLADAFIKNNIQLFYYHDKFEIDFLQQFDFKIVPIEIKATDGRTKSLKTIMCKEQEKIKFAIRIKDKNIGFVDNVLTIPHYLVYLLTNKTFNEMYYKNKKLFI